MAAKKSTKKKPAAKKTAPKRKAAPKAASRTAAMRKREREQPIPKELRPGEVLRSMQRAKKRERLRITLRNLITDGPIIEPRFETEAATRTPYGVVIHDIPAIHLFIPYSNILFIETLKHRLEEAPAAETKATETSEAA